MMAALLLTVGLLGAGDGQPRNLRVINPSTVDVALFRVHPRSQENLGLVHAGQELLVTVYPGEKLIAYFPCRRRTQTWRVTDALGPVWKLLARPCSLH